MTQARAAAMQASGPAEASAAEGLLIAGAHRTLRAVAEQYPELRATENFQQLSRNLSELEDEIQASRRIYNSNVQSYNTKIQIFPNSMVASSGGFTAREFFEITDAAEREPVAGLVHLRGARKRPRSSRWRSTRPEFLAGRALPARRTSSRGGA